METGQEHKVSMTTTVEMLKTNIVMTLFIEHGSIFVHIKKRVSNKSTNSGSKVDTFSHEEPRSKGKGLLVCFEVSLNSF